MTQDTPKSRNPATLEIAGLVVSLGGVHNGRMASVGHCYVVVEVALSDAQETPINSAVVLEVPTAEEHIRRALDKAMRGASS